MLSYEKIILLSQEFATNHQQINEFGNGDLWEVVQHNKFQDFTYPLLWMQDNGSVVNGNLLSFNFQVFAIDQVLNGERNENFVKSNMHKILLDYLAYFTQTKFYDLNDVRILFKILQNGNFQSFTERFDDTLTGWNMSVTFNIPFDYNACNIPTIGN